MLLLFLLLYLEQKLTNIKYIYIYIEEANWQTNKTNIQKTRRKEVNGKRTENPKTRNQREESTLKEIFDSKSRYSYSFKRHWGYFLFFFLGLGFKFRLRVSGTQRIHSLAVPYSSTRP